VPWPRLPPPAPDSASPHYFRADLTAAASPCVRGVTIS
jgi:hypothetical protein